MNRLKLIYPGTFIVGIIAYIFTVGIAFTTKGLVIGVLSASLPIVSNIYWVYSLWNETSTVYTLYVNINITLAMMILSCLLVQQIIKRFS